MNPLSSCTDESDREMLNAAVQEIAENLKALGPVYSSILLTQVWFVPKAHQAYFCRLSGCLPFTARLISNPRFSYLTSVFLRRGHLRAFLLVEKVLSFLGQRTRWRTRTRILDSILSLDVRLLMPFSHQFFLDPSSFLLTAYSRSRRERRRPVRLRALRSRPC